MNRSLGVELVKKASQERGLGLNWAQSKGSIREYKQKRVSNRKKGTKKGTKKGQEEGLHRNNKQVSLAGPKDSQREEMS